MVHVGPEASYGSTVTWALFLPRVQLILKYQVSKTVSDRPLGLKSMNSSPQGKLQEQASAYLTGRSHCVVNPSSFMSCLVDVGWPWVAY